MNENSEGRIEANKRSEKLVETILSFEKKRASILISYYNFVNDLYSGSILISWHNSLLCFWIYL